MKSILNWVMKNGWNIFSFIGVIGTFYFSLIYVPGYVKDITAAKVNITHESLVDDVQELLFYNKKLTIDDINSFIKAKELEQGTPYPYSSDELLLQIQDRFMGNKFIPLEKRESLMDTVKSIRSTYSKPKVAEKKNINEDSLVSMFVSAIGALIAAIGTYSIFRKIKIDKEIEADITSGDVINNLVYPNLTPGSKEFESMVGEVLNELGVLSERVEAGKDDGYDFEIKTQEQNYIVEVKRYSKLLGLATAREFIYKVNQSGKGGILIVSSGFTERTKQLINEHNALSENQKVYLVVAKAKTELKDILAKILRL